MALRVLSGRAMTRSLAVATLLLLALGASAAPEAAKPMPLPDAATEPRGARQVKNRLVLFSVDNPAPVAERDLAQDLPTTVILPVNINQAATRLADPQRLIYKQQFFQNTAVLSPNTDLPPSPL